jgi:hypothetical protein
MVTVPELRSLCEGIRSNDVRVKEIILVAHEGHLINKLKDKPGIILAAVYASTDRTGPPNSGIDVNTTWLFFLEKPSAGQSDAKEEAQFENIRSIAENARTLVEDIATDGCSYLSRHEPSGTQIVPEWAEFGGYNGWSMSLVF